MCNDNKLNDKWLIDPHGKYQSIEPSLFFFSFSNFALFSVSNYLILFDL